MTARTYVIEITGDVKADCQQVTYPADRHGPASTETTIKLSGGFVVAGYPDAVLSELAAVIDRHSI